jgi:hypothetical protein
MVTDDRGNAWLVIRYVMGHGTGVFSYGEAWYSLNGKNWGKRWYMQWKPI